MKKRNIAAVIMTTLVLATGCGAKEPAKTPAPSKAETEAVKNEETVKSEESADVPERRKTQRLLLSQEPSRISRISCLRL